MERCQSSKYPDTASNCPQGFLSYDKIIDCIKYGCTLCDLSEELRVNLIIFFKWTKVDYKHG